MFGLDWFDGSEVNFLIALAAGVGTFFASCLLPLVPTYLAYLSGISLSDESAGTQRWRIFRLGLMFVIGFVVTFVALGLTLNQLAGIIHPYRQAVEKLAGLLFIGLGLFMLGVFKTRFFAQERRFHLGGRFKNFRHLHAFLTGIAFGFGWTPCVGPVLAVILFWSARAATAFQGTMLLIAFGLGLGIPFLIIALGFEKIIPWLKSQQKLSRVINYVSGALVLLVGVLLILGRFDELSIFLISAMGIHPFSI